MNLIMIFLDILAGGLFMDMGPKAGMDFTFVFPEGQTLSIVEGALLQCKDSACQDAAPLMQAGPQHFACGANTCESIAYGYSEYNRLEITFSDGTTRQSNIFGKKYFSAKYRVMVNPGELLVEEQRGSGNPLIFFGILAILAFLIVGSAWLCLLIGYILLVVREGQERNSWSHSRRVYILAWIPALIIIGWGSVFTLATPITVLIEAAGYWILARLRSKPIFPGLTAVVMINAFTHPIFWAQVKNGNLPWEYWPMILALEVVILLVEAGLLYLPLRKHMTFREALGTSALLNIASFAVGLLVPW